MYVHTPFSTIEMIYDRSRTPAILPVFDPPSLFRFLTQHIWKFRLRDSAGTKLVSIRVCEGKCNDDIQSKFRNSFVARKKDFCFEFLLRNFCIFYFFFILSILRIFRYNYTYNSKLSRRKRESSAPYLQDSPGKGEFPCYAYNRVIRLRLSVQTIKLDLATLAAAHT